MPGTDELTTIYQWLSREDPEQITLPRWSCAWFRWNFKVDTKQTPFRRRHFQMHFFNENVWIGIKISLKFVPNGPINDILALVQIMAWRLRGDKPLSEPMMVSLPTHTCVTRPQWVKGLGIDLTEPNMLVSKVIYDNLKLVQVMAWCHQTRNHYLSQCWPRHMSPTTNIAWVYQQTVECLLASFAGLYLTNIGVKKQGKHNLNL